MLLSWMQQAAIAEVGHESAAMAPKMGQPGATLRRHARRNAAAPLAAATVAYARLA